MRTPQLRLTTAAQLSIDLRRECGCEGEYSHKAPLGVVLSPTKQNAKRPSQLIVIIMTFCGISTATLRTYRQPGAPTAERISSVVIGGHVDLGCHSILASGNLQLTWHVLSSYPEHPNSHAHAAGSSHYRGPTLH